MRRNIPEETTLSKPVGYFDFENIIWYCIWIKLFIHSRHQLHRITSCALTTVYLMKPARIINIILFINYLINIYIYKDVAIKFTLEVVHINPCIWYVRKHFKTQYNLLITQYIRPAESLIILNNKDQLRGLMFDAQWLR